MTNKIEVTALNRDRRWIPIRLSKPFCLLPNGLSPRVMYSRALEWLAVFDPNDERRLVGIEMLWQSFAQGYMFAGLELAEQRSVHELKEDPTGLSRPDAAQILAAWALKGYALSAKSIHFHYSDVFSEAALSEIFSTVKDHDDWYHGTWLYYNRSLTPTSPRNQQP